ncbi:MAG: glycosyltransferase 2 family protein [Thermoleophilaceae bacterium]|nr:glycosyltransferase 2 family protein [Thermoleophilaceae bacterium]
MTREETLLERIGAAGASAASMGSGSRWQRVLMIGLAVLIVGCLAAAIASQWSKLPDIQWRFAPGWLVLSLAALVAFQFVHATLWVLILRALGAPIQATRGRAVWSLTLLARYVPTNIALAVSRMALAEREGVPKRICGASIVYELGFTFGGAAALGAYFVVTLPDLSDQPLRWLALAAPVLSLVALDPAIFHRFADAALTRLGRATLPLSLSRLRVLGFFAAFVASFLIAGFAVYAFAEAIHGVAGDDIPTTIGAYSVGFAASVVAFVLPGGLGAREGAMAAALSPALPFAVALAVAVGIRLAQMAIEVLYAAITPVLARRASRADG